jgi:hypothetical protein
VLGPLRMIALVINREDILIIFAISMALMVLNHVHALGAFR